MPEPLIALIEDEDHLAQALLFNLAAEGYRTHHEADGDAALRWLLDATATADAPAAVLLDVMLPGTDGFAITRALREAGRFTPVLLLTARGRTEDVLEGFAAGADDYLPKPFDLHVLLARLHGLLRRTAWQQSSQGGADVVPEHAAGEVSEGERDHFQLGKQHVDLQALSIRGPEGTVQLTVMEADLLRFLLERPDQILSRKQILEEVWHVHAGTDTRPIDNFIVRLRRYLEPDPSRPVYLQTVRGVGYRFVPGQSAPATG